jgi:hypothetical protein
MRQQSLSQPSEAPTVPHDTNILARHFIWTIAALAWLINARANDATVFVSCTSLNIRPATIVQAGKTNAIAISAFSDGTINDELSFSVNESDPESHFAVIYLIQPERSLPYVGAMFLSAPGLGDANGDALTDFCEVALGATNYVTSGEVSFTDGSTNYPGTIAATWNRIEGVTIGTVALHMQVPGLGLDLPFTNEFEIYQYEGDLSYIATTTNVIASVNLGRLGAPGTIEGPFTLVRTDSVDLDYSAGKWTNSDNLKLPFESSASLGVSIAKGALPTYYYGLISFVDGLPELGFAFEYQEWYLDIFDPNDANRDGVPDIAEPPLDLTPPALSLAVDKTSLSFTITGDPGQKIIIDHATMLTAPVWSTVAAVTMTNKTQTVTLKAPSFVRGFYRAHL